MKFVFFIAMISIFSACGQRAADADKTLQSSPVSIIGGEKLSQGSLLAANIVAVWDPQNQFLCTGTLISKDVVLTAAHCVPQKATRLQVLFGTEISSILEGRAAPPQKLDIRSVAGAEVHPQYKAAMMEQRSIDQNDIALVKFAGSLPAGYRPATVLKSDEALRRGVDVTVAGFGFRKINVFEIEAKGHNKKKLQQGLDDGSIICPEKSRVCFLIEMENFGELYSAVAPILGFTETEIRLDESDGQGTCSGDSGGPAFLLKDGQYQVFGVTSRGDIFCDGEGVYTSVVAHAQWLARSLQALELR